MDINMQNPNFLSYPLSNQSTIAYGGSKDFNFSWKTKISEGGTANEMRWELGNHIGTHIDCPFHFSKNGKRVTDYPANFWVFNSPHMVELEVSKAEIIKVNKWCEEIPKEADLLILKTNFGQYRKADPETYWNLNPGLCPELGIWLRKERPNLRAIGFDFISITSYQNRDLGKKAHKSVLDPSFEGTPLVAIEDMMLNELKKTPSKVIVSPIRVEDADGAPATIFSF